MSGSKRIVRKRKLDESSPGAGQLLVCRLTVRKVSHLAQLILRGAGLARSPFRIRV